MRIVERQRAAVAAGIVRLAIAARPTARSPAPRRSTAIVGFKPTVGLVTGPHHPDQRQPDTAGPMTATVREAAALLT